MPSPSMGKRPPPPSNIMAVARRAGVSKATVSRYLNGRNIRSPARERVADAIRALGYAPSRLAQSLKSRRSTTIALVIPDVANAFYSEVVKGAEEALGAAGFHLVLAHTSEDLNHERDRLEALHRLRVDGYLIVPAPTPRQSAAPHLQQLPGPAVFVDRSPGFAADLVSSDNVTAGADATRHLLGLGHRRIGLLLPDRSASVHADRETGYRQGLKAASVTFDPDLVRRVPRTIADGAAATLSLLDGAKPTAIFSTSSMLAMGAVAGLARRGLGCPDDVSILGFDHHDWHDVFRPRLTVIAQSAFTMGRRAADLLLQRIRGERQDGPVQLLLQTELVARDSCAVLRAGHRG